MATVPKLLATEQIAPIPDSHSIKASDVGQGAERIEWKMKIPRSSTLQWEAHERNNKCTPKLTAEKSPGSQQEYGQRGD
jgi:hypothetical protein